MAETIEHFLRLLGEIEFKILHNGFVLVYKEKEHFFSDNVSLHEALQCLVHLNALE